MCQQTSAFRGAFLLCPSIYPSLDEAMAGLAKRPGFHDDQERTTPMGLVRYGYEFLESAFVMYERAAQPRPPLVPCRSEEPTSELQSPDHLLFRLLLAKKNWYR